MLVSDRYMLTRNYNAKIVDVNTRIHAVCACLPISLVPNVLRLHPWIPLHEPFGRLLVFHQVIMLSKILMRADSYIRLSVTVHFKMPTSSQQQLQPPQITLVLTSPKYFPAAITPAASRPC